ncbi:MAG: redoxin domain-containing protein [Planctomycetes bacterium]|nr:redoxin domain-containing protein [Planctomycetota bacterium]
MIKTATLILTTCMLAPAALAQDEVPTGKTVAPTGQEAKPTNPSEKLSQLRKTAKPYKIGDTVNAKLKFNGLNGKSLTMAQLRGKTVVLAWYSMTCPTMKPSLPKLKQLTSDLAGDDLVVIGVNSNAHEMRDAKPGIDEEGKPTKPYAKLRKHLEKQRVNFTVCTDPGNFIADLFNARTTPHMFVIDAKGVLRYAGALDDDPKNSKQAAHRKNYVRDALHDVQNDKEVRLTTTKSYGCAVKRAPKPPTKRPDTKN